jgi:large subunit ribosomal protein L12
MENVYAALLLHKAGKEITENNLKKIVDAAGIVAEESSIKSLVASLKGVDIEKELATASLISATAVVTGEAKTEEKKEKPKEEKKAAAAEGLSALFG